MQKKTMVVENKLCMINMTGDPVIDPAVSYDMIYYPSSGLCLVELDERYGYINMAGEEVIPVQYANACEFSASGVAFVMEPGCKGGYINTDGEWMIKPQYDTGSVFSHGLAAVSKHDMYYFINEEGERTFTENFRYAGGFTEAGLAKIILLDGREGLIDLQGNVLLILKQGCKLKEFSDGAKLTTLEVNGRKALVNLHGEIITEIKYEEVIITPEARLHPFRRNGLWGYLDNEGNEVIPNTNLSATPFTSYKIATVNVFDPLSRNGRKTLYINEHDDVVEPRLVEAFLQSFQDRYAQVYRFHHGLSLAMKKPQAVEIA